MRIYKKCPCCGKTMFLLLGSDFGNEIELGSAFGSKDNIPHQDTDHTEDYHCLNKFLTCLETSHGSVYLSLNEKEENKLPESFKELILNWTEKKKKSTEPQPTSNNNEPENKKTFQEWKDLGQLNEPWSRDDDYQLWQVVEDSDLAGFKTYHSDWQTRKWTLEELKEAINSLFPL